MTLLVILVTFPGYMTSFRLCAAMYGVMVGGNVTQTLLIYYDVIQYQKVDLALQSSSM